MPGKVKEERKIFKIVVERPSVIRKIAVVPDFSLCPLFRNYESVDEEDEKKIVQNHRRMSAFSLNVLRIYFKRSCGFGVLNTHSCSRDMRQRSGSEKNIAIFLKIITWVDRVFFSFHA